MFRKVDSVVWDLMTGTTGISTPNGICAITSSGKSEDGTQLIDPQVSVNMFEEFGISLPAFAHTVPTDSITLGDMIYSSAQSRVLGWVIVKNQKSFTLMRPDGTTSSWVPPKVQMIGFDSGTMVLRSLINMLPGGNQQLGSLQGMLLPMLSMGLLNDSDSDSGFDLESMMPMLLMGQIQPGVDQTQANSSMQMMMQMMLMSKMFGNKSTGSNPFKHASGTSSRNENFFNRK